MTRFLSYFQSSRKLREKVSSVMEEPHGSQPATVVQARVELEVHPGQNPAVENHPAPDIRETILSLPEVSLFG